MKTKLALKLLCFCLLPAVFRLSAQAQGTAFTYQGQLGDSGLAANGTYDLTFTAFDAVVNGNVAGAAITKPATVVSNGFFSVALDFGAGVFTGPARWLEIAVATNGSATFTTLVPRQPLTPVPYSIRAGNAGLADVASGVAGGTVGAAQLLTAGVPAPGQVLGYNGAELVWQDAVLGGATGGWSLGGNLGTTPGPNYLGTADNQALELRVGGMRALRLEPNTNGAPNFIAGSFINSAAGGIVGATVGGGGAANYGGLGYTNSVGSDFSTVAGGARNSAGGWGATVGGGYLNVAAGASSSIGGGDYNSAFGLVGTVGGGGYNTASDQYATVAGGYANTASGWGAFVGGGGVDDGSGQAYVGNTASGFGSVVAGGNGNLASGDESSVVGGALNTASGFNSVVAGGVLNTASATDAFAAGYNANAVTIGSFVWADASGGAFSSTAANQFLVRASGGVGIGTSQTPPGGLRVASGGLAVTGASSPNYPGSAGVFIEKVVGVGAVYAYDYTAGGPLSLALNSPGGKVGVGTLSPQYTLDVNGTTRTHSIIITGGADLAEPFQMGRRTIEKGSVMVIDEEHPGELKVSTRAYDTRVAGIVSGANGVNPGIALHQEGALEGGQNVALSGRVYVLAEAAHGAIKPGDLLTTSETPGHAMRVTEHVRAQGAILGKAMSELKEGTGLVLVLVTLQ